MNPEKQFLWTWQSVSGGPLEREYRFDSKRRWRFDFADPEARVAIEIEGGLWNRGRHIRPKGFLNDCEKYNTASLSGWVVFRLPPDLIRVGYLEAILSFLRNRKQENRKERKQS